MLFLILKIHRDTGVIICDRIITCQGNKRVRLLFAQQFLGLLHFHSCFDKESLSFFTIEKQREEALRELNLPIISAYCSIWLWAYNTRGNNNKNIYFTKSVNHLLGTDKRTTNLAILQRFRIAFTANFEREIRVYNNNKSNKHVLIPWR